MIDVRGRHAVRRKARRGRVVDEEGHAHAEPLCGSANPSAAAVAVERAFVELIATERNQVLSSMEPPLRPGLVEDCDKVAAECSGVVCVGLQRRDDFVGAVCLHRVGGGPLEAWEGADVERFARFAALAIHQMTERERAERHEVTGLPGRTFLLRELDRRIDSGRPFGLGCIDFDGLKAVNDRLGYEAGNLLICAVASFAAASSSDACTVAAATNSSVCSTSTTSVRSSGAVVCSKRHSTALRSQRSSHRVPRRLDRSGPRERFDA